MRCVCGVSMSVREEIACEESAMCVSVREECVRGVCV